MKFYCDQCQTKYSIADEKVRGKVLKVRCKNCSHVITVREPVQPVPSQFIDDRAPLKNRAASASAVRRERVESLSNVAAARAVAPSSEVVPISWHYALNGESFGPYSLDYLRAQFASARLSDAAYVWNETFDAWKPVREVAEFSDALARGLISRPARPTIGISEGFQAIRVEKQSAEQPVQPPTGRAADVAVVEPLKKTVAEKNPATSGRSTDPLRAKLSSLLEEKTVEAPPAALEEFPTLVESSAGFTSEFSEVEESEPVEEASPVEAAPEQPALLEEETLKADPLPVVALDRKKKAESASERLQRLRERLKVDEVVETAPSKRADVDLALGDTADLATEVELEERTLEASFSAEADVEGSEVTAEEPGQASSVGGQHAGLFAALDEAATLQDDAAALRAAEHREESEFFSSEDVADDEVPFLSIAPKLSSSHAYDKPAEEGYSGSLLIELDKLKKQQRSKWVGAGVAAALLFVVVGGIVFWISTIEEPIDEQPQVIAQKEAPREIVFRRYTKEEHGRIRNLIEMPDEAVENGTEESSAEKPTAKESRSVASSRSPVKLPSNEARISAPSAQKNAPAVDPFEAAMSGASARNSATVQSGLQRNDAHASAGMKMPSTQVAGAKGSSSDEDDRFRALAAIQMPSGEAPIYQPSESLKNRANRPSQAGGGLTDAQAAAGFRTVRQSIGLCRERTMQRGLKIDAQKIYVTLEIQPTGKVSSYTVEPNSVRDTEFDRCMISHTPRWKFDSYAGEPTLIKAPFILQ